MEFIVLLGLLAALIFGIPKLLEKLEKKQFQRNLILSTLAASWICIFLCISIYFLRAADLSYEFIYRHFPESYTTPLNYETVMDLCNILQLQKFDKRCSGEDVYSFDFYPDFIRRYDRWTPREQVDNDISKYLINCSDWVVTFADGAFQDCKYDFKGDGAFTLEIEYSKSYSETIDASGSVWKICTYAIRNLSFGTTSICNSP